MGTQQTNDDGALGLPLVALGPDSTRVTDDARVKGYTLWGPDKDDLFDWRSTCGRWWWFIGQARWVPFATVREREIGSLRRDAYARHQPNCHPPGFKVSAVIRDEQRMADVFREAALAISLMRSAVELLDLVAEHNGVERYKTATNLLNQADSLETAIARANGGAE